MNEPLLDENVVHSTGVLINKNHSKARIVIFFYTVFIIFYILIMSEYRSLEKWDIINFLGKILFFGFLFHNNFKQLKNEKTNQFSDSMLRKWEGFIFVILLVVMLIHSINHFLDIIREEWYRFPTLVYFSIILSIISIITLEYKYLKLNRNN